MRIQLINSGNDECGTENANTASYPPLGIISIASTIEKYFSDYVSLNLIDGQIDNLKNTIDRIQVFKPDILCISMYCTTIKYSLRCAEIGSQIGSKVILGNDHAKTHYETILLYLDYIDFISLDEFGERTMYFFVNNVIKGLPCDKIPLTAYRKDDKIIINEKPKNVYNEPIWENPLDFFPLPNRMLLNSMYFNTYLRNFKTNYKSRVLDVNTITGITTINRYRGCQFYKKKCLYCSICELKPCYSNQCYWDDIVAAQSQINANCFYECCDNIIAFKEHLIKMIATRPINVEELKFLFYASSLGLTKEICELMQTLGTFCINFGFDSGNDRVVKILKGNKYSVKLNKDAAKLVTEYKIDLHVSFVLIGLGSMNETKKSLEDTYEMAKWLTEYTNTTTIECALLYPDKSAPIGNLIWDPTQYSQLLKKGYDLSFIDMNKIMKMHEKYENEIYINPEIVTVDFAEACGTNVELLYEYQSKIKDYCRDTHTRFGYSRYGKEHLNYLK